MKVNSHKLFGNDIPLPLQQLHTPPELLYISGVPFDQWLNLPKLGVVGSRKATSYGRAVTQKLVWEAARSGVVIISGLAFGIDSIAHQAAINAGGITVAVLPGPLEQIYPASHRHLAQVIIDSGGALISEYPSGSEIHKHNFIARNRLIAALADALLVPQAASHSGSLHTVNFALEQGKTVMAVPGEIDQPMNAGSNNLLKTGALMVTEAADIFSAMNIAPTKTVPRSLVKTSALQRQLFQLIGQGISETEALVEASGSNSSELSSALSLLEIDGYICANAGRWYVS